MEEEEEEEEENRDRDRVICHGFPSFLRLSSRFFFIFEGGKKNII